MAELKKCQKCGEPVPANAPFGHCPKCLLALGLGPVPGEALEPPAEGAAPQSSTSLGKVRYFGDYELLGQIGRGGMGIVYKARQLSLNRFVALKMIGAGGLASPTAVQRFQIEGEAAAKLDHPNIVAIYEVGLHQGQHYLSMKLIEGRNLDEHMREGRFQSIGNSPTPDRAATRQRQLAIARLVATVARAVHYAHQHGVLHRDLKPSNILMDGEGKPHLTDFGLAKILEHDVGVTRSAEVMGTPSYMSPEQAMGRQLSTSTDIYSLGVILYELLTGQPPFRAETPLETLRLVCDQEPLPPRLLNPVIPVSLETISLKCLAKEPAGRYASARDLAEELGRFVADEPILALPEIATEFGQSRWADPEYAQSYRDEADYTIPHRRYLFHVLRSFFRHFLGGHTSRSVCEVGCGDGVLAQELLTTDDTISLTLVDGSREMLDSAQRRLGSRTRTSYVRATFEALIRREVEIGEFDFIVSALAIHHLTQAEKAALFRRLIEQLHPGGWFLNLDAVLPDQPGFADWYYELWREWIIEPERDALPVKSFRRIPDEARNNPDNKLSTLAAQLKALSAAGFVEVGCHYRNGLGAIFGGMRP